MSLKVLYLFFCNLCLSLRSKTSLFVCITQNLLLQLNKADLLSSLLHGSFFRNIKHPPRCFSISLSFAACWIKAAEFEASSRSSSFKDSFFLLGLRKRPDNTCSHPNPGQGSFSPMKFQILPGEPTVMLLTVVWACLDRCASLQTSYKVAGSFLLSHRLSTCSLLFFPRDQCFGLCSLIPGKFLSHHSQPVKIWPACLEDRKRICKEPLGIHLFTITLAFWRPGFNGHTHFVLSAAERPGALCLKSLENTNSWWIHCHWF